MNVADMHVYASPSGRIVDDSCLKNTFLRPFKSQHNDECIICFKLTPSTQYRLCKKEGGNFPNYNVHQECLYQCAYKYDGKIYIDCPDCVPGSHKVYIDNVLTNNLTGYCVNNLSMYQQIYRLNRMESAFFYEQLYNLIFQTE